MTYLGNLGKKQVLRGCKTSRSLCNLISQKTFIALRGWEDLLGHYPKGECLRMGLCYSRISKVKQEHYVLRVCLRMWLNKRKEWGRELCSRRFQVTDQSTWLICPRWRQSCSCTWVPKPLSRCTT